MSMKISVILLFLLYIGILIFAEKIFDHHHAYNRRSEITHMNLVTCNGTAKVWRSASKNLSYISIFTCRILNVWRSIVLAIKKLYAKFLKNQGGLNILKMRCNGKCESVTLHYFFHQLQISRFIL